MEIAIKVCSVVTRQGCCKKWVLDTTEQENDDGDLVSVATLNPEDPGLAAFVGVRRSLKKHTTIFDEMRAARCSASFAAMKPVHSVSLRDHRGWRKRTERVDLLLQSFSSSPP